MLRQQRDQFFAEWGEVGVGRRIEWYVFKTNQAVVAQCAHRAFVGAWQALTPGAPLGFGAWQLPHTVTSAERRCVLATRIAPHVSKPQQNLPLPPRQRCGKLGEDGGEALAGRGNADVAILGESK